MNLPQSYKYLLFQSFSLKHVFWSVWKGKITDSRHTRTYSSSHTERASPQGNIFREVLKVLKKHIKNSILKCQKQSNLHLKRSHYIIPIEAPGLSSTMRWIIYKSLIAYFQVFFKKANNFLITMHLHSTFQYAGLWCDKLLKWGELMKYLNGKNSKDLELETSKKFINAAAHTLKKWKKKLN